VGELTCPDEELTLETVPVYVRLTMSADADEVRAANAATAAMHFKTSAEVEYFIFIPTISLSDKTILY
jgi:hypothetical protein